MKALIQERQKAIALRKQGLSYREILDQVPVAKSSLSLWLKDLPLTKNEQSSLKKRKDSNITKGRIRAAAANRKHRLAREKEYFTEATHEFKIHQDNPLFHIGISLYWAEGAKRNNMFHFMNSDVNMIQIYILWLERFTEYKKSDLGFRLYLHDPYKHENWEGWWKKKLSIEASQFKKTIIKPTQLSIKKRPNYKGCIRLEVPRSTKLLTKMKFWTNMLVDHYKNQ